jgi:hypothetical protein
LFALRIFGESEDRCFDFGQLTHGDWRIFEELAVADRPGPEVARERGMTVAAVLMVKSSVQKKLRDEIRHLEAGEL